MKIGLNNRRKETARNCSLQNGGTLKQRNVEAKSVKKFAIILPFRTIQRESGVLQDFESGKPYISLIVH
ncbi:hypothetical protein QQP08_005207 [Theobroma cacao]|nr:hypothetical protein QQP08_005207 [Theobroma cacao]